MRKARRLAMDSSPQPLFENERVEEEEKKTRRKKKKKLVPL